MKQLSIIVPIYKVEKYIRECIESIYRQGLKEENYEIILVNDGTPDKSMEMIDDIILNHNNIIVINQYNQGLSIARNHGIEKATGEYIAFLDSDDILIDNSFQPLLEMSLRHHSDLTVAEYLTMNDEAITKYLSQSIAPPKNYHLSIKSGQQILIDHIHPRHCYVWRSLYRRLFIQNNKIFFIPKINFEDIPFTHECLLKAGKCIKTDLPIYLYRTGNASITGIPLDSQKAMDFCIAISHTWNLQDINGLSPTIKQRINDNAFDIFSLVSYCITYEIESMTKRVEIIKFLNRIAPNLTFTHGIKQRFITWFYKNMPSTYIYFKTLYLKFAKSFIYKSL